MSTEPAPAEPKVDARPWWAKGGWLAVFFVLTSAAGFLLGVFGPIVSEQKISEKQRELEQGIADSTQRIENLGRRVEVSRLLFDHYFGKSAAQQTAVITYLQYQFPEDLSEKGLQAVLTTEAKGEARRSLRQSVAAIREVSGSKLDRAVGYERAGFEAVIDADLAGARSAFSAAYAAYPEYHNVDEISHKLLTRETVRRYEKGSDEDRERILDQVVGQLLTTYAWGIPPELRPRLEAI